MMYINKKFLISSLVLALSATTLPTLASPKILKSFSKFLTKCPVAYCLQTGMGLYGLKWGVMMSLVGGAGGLIAYTEDHHSSEAGKLCNVLIPMIPGVMLTTFGGYNTIKGGWKLAKLVKTKLS